MIGCGGLEEEMERRNWLAPLADWVLLLKPGFFTVEEWSFLTPNTESGPNSDCKQKNK